MAWTPQPNRAKKDGKAVVSDAELAQFRKEFGADKTLRDLLNADKSLVRAGSSAADMRARGSNAGKVGGSYEMKQGGSKKSADIPKGAETAPKSSGKDTSGPSNLDRVLMGLGGAGAAYGVYKGTKALMGASRASKTAPVASRIESYVGRPVTTRLDDAAAAFSKPKAAEVTKSTAKEMPKAKNVILKPVAKEAKQKAEEAARKKEAEAMAKRIAEKKDDIVSKRMRSREEFAKGGSVTKRKK